MADASCPVIEQENVRIGQTLVGSAVSAATMTGETPMGYLSRWRLNWAALWLRSSDSTVAQVATRVGYQQSVQALLRPVARRLPASEHAGPGMSRTLLLSSFIQLLIFGNGL